MDSRISFNSAASPPSVDRIVPAGDTSSADSSDGGPSTASRSPQDTVKFTTVREAKLAELQGKLVSPGEEQMVKAIEHANKAMLGATTSFEFSIHEKTRQIMVKVIDKDTGEVIREIPPEKTLDMVAKMWELAGILVDKKV